jgi:type IV secretory pathway VirD2 relaxase
VRQVAGQSGADRPARLDTLPLRQMIAARLQEDPEDLSPKLPHRLKSASGTGVKASIARRLATGKMFGGGARGGSLGASNGSSFGSPAIFVGARQRVMVKAFVGRHGGAGGAKNAGQAVSRHLRYLAREGMGVDETPTGFYGPDGGLERHNVHEACSSWDSDRHHFRLIISPEHSDKIDDMDAYIRDIMERVAGDLREPKMAWVAINHHDTDQPHAHVLIRGKRSNGRDLVIPRKVISYGIRGHAEDCAQELLGDQSRSEAERGLFTRTSADRWTDIDMKLEKVASANNGVIPRAEIDRHDTFGAVTRARIAHLARLELVAADTQDGVSFSEDLKARLDRLQAAQDQIRSHWAAKRLGALAGLSGARVEPSFKMAKPPAENIVQTETPNERTSPAKAFDQTIERLTPLDVELMRRGQLRADAATTMHMGEEVEAALKARADHLVMSGQAITQGQGLGYQPKAWAKLREAELKHVMSRDLGIKTLGHLSYGQAEGFVEGHVTTSLGKHAIIDRGMGYAAMAIQAGQELAIGQAVGRAMGVER